MIPLKQVTVASPCHESWDEMTGDDRKRFCGHCRKHVYNLSAMTEAEAQTVLNIDSPCVRFYRRTDGTLLTQDCPVGLRRVRLRFAAAVAWLLSLVGCTFASPQPTMGVPPPPRPTIGVPPPPPMQQPTMGAVRPVAPPIQGKLVHKPTPVGKSKHEHKGKSKRTRTHPR